MSDDLKKAFNKIFGQKYEKIRVYEKFFLEKIDEGLNILGHEELSKEDIDFLMTPFKNLDQLSGTKYQTKEFNELCINALVASFNSLKTKTYSENYSKEQEIQLWADFYNNLGVINSGEVFNNIAFKIFTKEKDMTKELEEKISNFFFVDFIVINWGRTHTQKQLEEVMGPKPSFANAFNLLLNLFKK
jgi:hypothetical protein